MADNTTLDAGVGGDSIRDKDRAGVKTPVVGLDLNIGGGSETLMTGAMPVTDNGSTLSVDDGASSLSVDDNGGSLTVDSLPEGADGAVSQPTRAVQVGGWDGTNFQAAVTDSAGRFQVGVNGAVAVTDNGGSLTVDGTVGITANSSVNVAQVAGTTTDTNSGVKSAGTQRVVLATDQPQLTNALKVDGSAVTQPVSGTVTANVTPVTTGGLSISRVISAASTNATSAKGSAGQVYGWYLSNVNAAARYLKLYNKATAPTVGTDTPLMTILIPGNTAGAGANVEYSNGVVFGTGIAYAITTGATDADTGAVAANEIIVNLLYK